MDPATPAATVADGTMPSQRTVRSTLDTIAEATADAGIKPPAVTVIGSVAGFDPTRPGPMTAVPARADRTLHLVRHGQSTWNELRLVQGQQNAPELTELGRGQATEAAARRWPASVSAPRDC